MFNAISKWESTLNIETKVDTASLVQIVLTINGNLTLATWNRVDDAVSLASLTSLRIVARKSGTFCQNQRPSMFFSLWTISSKSLIISEDAMQSIDSLCVSLSLSKKFTDWYQLTEVIPKLVARNVYNRYQMLYEKLREKCLSLRLLLVQGWSVVGSRYSS